MHYSHKKERKLLIDLNEDDVDIHDLIEIKNFINNKDDERVPINNFDIKLGEG